MTRIVFNSKFALAIAVILCDSILQTGNASLLQVASRQGLPLKLKEDEVRPLKLNATLSDSAQENNIMHGIQLLFQVADVTIASVEENRTLPLTTNFSLSLRGHFLGRTLLKIFVNKSDYITVNSTIKSGQRGDNSTSWYELPDTFDIVVSRKERPIDMVFNVVIITLVVLANVAMGCKVEVPVIKKTLKRPVAPVTGFASQFILMPLISFMFAYFLNFDPAIALGFFAMGCCPGGSASNVYSYLLGGDVSLSVTMTFISTVAALGMLPLWLFTLGTMVLYKQSGVRIPFENIITSLLGLVIPVGLGLLIKYKRPRWAEKIVKLVRPLVVLFLLVIFTLGVYANLYIFDLLEPLVLIAGALVPYCGFIFGGFVGFLVRQPKKNIITIAIETGIQNTGIAIVLLRFSLEPPDSDLSIVAPIAAAIFTPVPLVIAIIITEIRKRCCRKESIEVNKNDTDNTTMLSNMPKCVSNDEMAGSYIVNDINGTDKDKTDTE